MPLPHSHKDNWPPTCIAVTGMLGSGKSTAVSLLAQKGLPVIDCDRLARKVTAPGSQGLERLNATFGDGILTPAGEMDRGYVLKLVLESPAARKLLEEIVHPLVLQEMDMALQNLARNHEKIAICEVPLLFEAGWHSLFNINCLIAAPEEMCISRIIKRNSINRETAKAWLKMQLPLSEKKLLADYVIMNDGSINQLEERVDQFYHWLSNRYCTLLTQR